MSRRGLEEDDVVVAGEEGGEQAQESRGARDPGVVREGVRTRPWEDGKAVARPPQVPIIDDETGARESMALTPSGTAAVEEF